MLLDLFRQVLFAKAVLNNMANVLKFYWQGGNALTVLLQYGDRLKKAL